MFDRLSHNAAAESEGARTRRLLETSSAPPPAKALPPPVPAAATPKEAKTPALPAVPGAAKPKGKSTPTMTVEVGGAGKPAVGTPREPASPTSPASSGSPSPRSAKMAARKKANPFAVSALAKEAQKRGGQTARTPRGGVGRTLSGGGSVADRPGTGSRLRSGSLKSASVSTRLPVFSACVCCFDRAGMPVSRVLRSSFFVLRSSFFVLRSSFRHCNF